MNRCLRKVTCFRPNDFHYAYIRSVVIIKLSREQHVTCYLNASVYNAHVVPTEHQLISVLLRGLLFIQK